MKFVVRLARDSHVVVLQETRGSSRDLSEFVDFLPGWSTYGSFTAEGNAGGVVFLVAPASVALYTSIVTEVVIPGRIAVLRMRGPEAPPLDIYNFHLVPNGLHSVPSQLHLLSASFSPLRAAITIVIVDVNVYAPGEGRLDLHTGRLSIDNSPLVDLVGDTFEHFHEIVAQGYFRVQLRGGKPQLLSRIDRVFMKSPVQSLLGGRCFAQYCVAALDRALPSDHAPLEVRFLPPRTGGRFKVPR